MFPTFLQVVLLTFMNFSALLMCISSFLAALLNSRHQAASGHAAASLLGDTGEKGRVKSIALPPTWYSPVCSALQKSLSYRGKAALVVGAEDLTNSMKKKMI